MKVRINAMRLATVVSFAGIRGRSQSGCKDVYFCRWIGNAGQGDDCSGWTGESLGRYLGSCMGPGIHYRYIRELPLLTENDRIRRLSETAAGWRKEGKLTKEGIRLPSGWNMDDFLEALEAVDRLFRKTAAHLSDTIEKNFLVKLLYWAETVLEAVTDGWTKWAIGGSIGTAEYLFAYLVVRLGVDVLLLPEKGKPSLSDELRSLSLPVETGRLKDAVRPKKKEDFQTAEQKQEKIDQKSFRAPERQKEHTVRLDAQALKRPERHGKSPDRPIGHPKSGTSFERRERSFEELARMASSVVMITIHDASGQVKGTGSGIMIRRDGYILTNFHVVSSGRWFSIRIENDEKIYRTDELIKYHPVFDLALIRIRRQLEPMRLYDGRKPLVRGQQVVAIGSPLGLFNSVSDGIISGFRTMKDVDMIQFTAPTSPGSSGGAVLNMYGELIGISTAGMEHGQNLNLAVHFQAIRGFLNN